MDQLPVNGFAINQLGTIIAVLVSHGSVRNDILHLPPQLLRSIPRTWRDGMPMMEFILPGEQQDHHAGLHEVACV